MRKVRTVIPLAFVIAFCWQAAMVAQTPQTDSIRPLKISDKLITLQDPEVIIMQNPYYKSQYAKLIPIYRFNTKVPILQDAKLLSLSSDKISLTNKETNPLLSIQPTGIQQFLLGLKIDRNNLYNVFSKNPTLLNTCFSDLESSKLNFNQIAADPVEINNKMVDIKKASKGFELIKLDRKYWDFGWESNIQFSQNYVSKNWYKGGGSNLNLYNKQLFTYNYNRGKISWINELEWRLSAYTSEADTISKFRVADDLLRLHTNFGIQAYESLFYTLDAETKTSLFTRREENKREVLSALFSPVMLNVGLGMRYVLDKKYTSTYGRRIRLSANVSPLSYDFRWSYKHKGIDLKRHGFANGKNIYSAFGSNIKIESIFDYSSTISWQSRLNYNTSYKRVEVEWENGLNFAISRFFSTRINVMLRYDDAVPITPENPSPIQINEILSFGFHMII